MIIQEVIQDERGGAPSASGLERLMLCPGSWQLESSIPRVEEASRAALVGTMLHEVLAGVRSEEVLTEQQRWIVGRCREIVGDVEQQLGFDGELEDRRHFVEERLWFYREDGQPLFSGQVDYAVVQGRRALVIDYKTGSGPVTPIRENYQMRAMAVLFARAHELDEVYVAIVQPLVEPPLTVALYGVEDLRLAEIDLLVGLQMAFADGAERTPGPRQCRYCRGRSVCPEVRNEALTLVPAEVLTLTEQGAKPELPALSPDQLAELLPKIEIAEKVIREIRKQAREMLERDPDAIDGYRLKPGSERRSISDAQGAFSQLSRVLTPEQFAACCTVQIGKLEESLRSVTGMTARETKEMLAQLLGDALVRKVSESTLERDGGGESAIESGDGVR